MQRTSVWEVKTLGAMKYWALLNVIHNKRVRNRCKRLTRLALFLGFIKE